ncbi:non-ribosomal peptide synthetase module [Sporosarcina sp. PTS2304]|nr:non-ribosomal peptide synthetase module [Sporosarcina sp. PTS2304]
MLYEAATVRQTFEMFQILSTTGKAGKTHYHLYLADDKIRGLINEFVKSVGCDLITVGQELLLIPTVGDSPFHVSNEYLRKTYLKSGATNADLYLLYFTTLVLFGEFYNSYLSQEPTRDFIQISDWVIAVQQRIETLKEHDVEDLKSCSLEFSYNWQTIIDKWDSMDDLKEQAKKQTGNTISRLSFLDTVRRFLVDQGLVQDIGNNEIKLTEKAKTVIQRYFMDLDYNRGILEFLYRKEAEKKEDSSDADNLED